MPRMYADIGAESRDNSWDQNKKKDHLTPGDQMAQIVSQNWPTSNQPSYIDAYEVCRHWG
jgi:hypothetical protein